MLTGKGLREKQEKTWRKKLDKNRSTLRKSLSCTRKFSTLRKSVLHLEHSRTMTTNAHTQEKISEQAEVDHRVSLCLSILPADISEQHRWVILYLGMGHTQASTAQMLGYSAVQVSKLAREYITYIRQVSDSKDFIIKELARGGVHLVVELGLHTLQQYIIQRKALNPADLLKVAKVGEIFSHILHADDASRAMGASVDQHRTTRDDTRRALSAVHALRASKDDAKPVTGPAGGQGGVSPAHDCIGDTVDKPSPVGVI